MRPIILVAALEPFGEETVSPLFLEAVKQLDDRKIGGHHIVGIHCF